jgi:hypothetical protein
MRNHTDLTNGVAGTSPGRETNDMLWLTGIVQPLPWTNIPGRNAQNRRNDMRNYGKLKEKLTTKNKLNKGSIKAIFRPFYFLYFFDFFDLAVKFSFIVSSNSLLTQGRSRKAWAKSSWKLFRDSWARERRR